MVRLEPGFGTYRWKKRRLWFQHRQIGVPDPIFELPVQKKELRPNTTSSYSSWYPIKKRKGTCCLRHWRQSHRIGARNVRTILIHLFSSKQFVPDPAGHPPLNSIGSNPPPPLNNLLNHLNLPSKGIKSPTPLTRILNGILTLTYPHVIRVDKPTTQSEQ